MRDQVNLTLPLVAGIIEYPTDFSISRRLSWYGAYDARFPVNDVALLRILDRDFSQFIYDIVMRKFKIYRFHHYIARFFELVMVTGLASTVVVKSVSATHHLNVLRCHHESNFHFLGCARSSRQNAPDHVENKNVFPPDQYKRNTSTLPIFLSREGWVGNVEHPLSAGLFLNQLIRKS